VDLINLFLIFDLLDLLVCLAYLSFTQTFFSDFIFFNVLFPGFLFLYVEILLLWLIILKLAFKLIEFVKLLIFKYFHIEFGLGNNQSINQSVSQSD